ncbi:hypothetical protein DF185_09780 [Marinifilum breve]|uniref:DUF3278 domain-containing protein n=1 Tax=Marinifilum breve TaxID=2184082 RepID=A0A2V4ACL9_9BACT|nr:hypothetical protein [Marinifilum breve]PXY01744.1 hypothetical protein DF185_09780 [Marinifilum breve]
MNNEQIKHLEFIQSVITRMNTNSFQLKGWMITLVSALLALYANSKNVYFVYIAIVPVMIFWFLDSYYLQQERKFRGIYNDVTGLTPDEEKQEVRLFEMPLQNYKKRKYHYCSSFFSATIFPLYGITAILLWLGGLILEGCIKF